MWSGGGTAAIQYSGGTAALSHSALEVVCAERCTVTLHYSETVFSNWPGNEATHCYAECWRWDCMQHCVLKIPTAARDYSEVMLSAGGGTAALHYSEGIRCPKNATATPHYLLDAFC